MEYKYFCQEYANKLLEYKDNRTELIKKIERALNNADKELPLLLGAKITDISPFSAMGILLRQRVFDTLLPEFKKEFDIKAPIDDGLQMPLQLTMQAYFTVEENNPQVMWDFFEIAINYADNPTEELKEQFIEYYDKCINIKGFKFNLAYCLYWINPEFYVPLDGNSRNYLLNDLPDLMENYDNFKYVLSGEEYLNLIDDLNEEIKAEHTKFDSFPDLSDKSYNQVDSDDKKSYWVYAPGKDAYAWENFYEKGIMGLGWPDVGDISQYESIDDIANKTGLNKRSAKEIWEFYNSIQVGDVIYAKKGSDTIIGKGYVESDCYFNDAEKDFKNYRYVKWIIKGNWDNTGIHYINTLTNITNKQDLIDKIENAINSSENNKVVNNMKNIEFKSENIIFYGVPGCGKSYFIKHEYIKDYENKEEQVERVVFHPDYTYSDFIGQVLPKSENNDVKYEFEPGPFTKILKKAHNNPTVEYFLIIEEINRGNAPAIFGDIFQLLDRDDDGESEYSITNSDIAVAVFKDKDKNDIADKVFADKKIKIPKNLTLVATMNTSDQNVFTLDTAFQRRWDMELIENKFDKDKIKDMYIPGTDCKWSVFWEKINNKIESNSNSLSSEDKRLGTYFVKESNLWDNPNDKDDKNKIKKFAEKVFKYLWDDAFKMDKYICFNKDFKTLEAVIKEFNSSKDLSKIFNSNIDFKSVEDKSSEIIATEDNEEE